jgi:nicotinamidase-related amidase
MVQTAVEVGTPALNALLLVDFQVGFVRAETEYLLKPVQELVYNNFFSLVIATRFLNVQGSLWQTAIHWDGLLSAREQALAVSLPPASILINKKSYGIPHADLERLLKQLGDSRVFLAGIESDVCVAVIAASLFDAGLAPYILCEFTGTNWGADHQAHALHTLARIVGRDQMIEDFRSFSAANQTKIAEK